MITEILTYIALAIVSAIGGLLIAQYKRVKALIKGTQSLLRCELYAMYRIGVKRGYTSLMEKSIFTSLYEQYHALGQNGTMDTYYKQYIALPTQESKRKKGRNAKSL